MPPAGCVKNSWRLSCVPPVFTTSLGAVWRGVRLRENRPCSSPPRVFRAVSGGLRPLFDCVKNPWRLSRVPGFHEVSRAVEQASRCVKNRSCSLPHRVFRAVSGGSQAACRLREKPLSPVVPPPIFTKSSGAVWRGVPLRENRSCSLPPRVFRAVSGGLRPLFDCVKNPWRLSCAPGFHDVFRRGLERRAVA
jgi:hypothetical protein